MKSKLLIIISIIITAALSFNLLMPVSPTYADNEDVCSQKGVPDPVKKAAGCNGNSDEVIVIVTNILYTVIGISGLIAVIFIVIGGFNYMSSTGDPGKVKKAKDTILYACIGLVVCALAFAIVNWTINAIEGNSQQSAESSEESNE